jgi:hypothetical protein
MNENKFSDGSTSGFEELPVPFAWLNWTRGDAKLQPLKATDPGAYFGGWRAFVNNTDRTTGEEHANPVIPLPIVERVSEDGKHPYSVYATNVLNFLPIQHRTRFEMREKTTDQQTGREYNKLVAVSQEKRQGYSPCRQVFGLVFNGEDYAPAVVVINKWSAFISFEKAGQKWNKIHAPAGTALVRRYGSVGIKDDKGKMYPKFETFGQGRSTPINAIDTEHPQFVPITNEINDLYEQSLAWKNCSRWNADGKVEEDPEVSTILTKFLSACDEIGLSNVEIDQIVKENGGDYSKCLAAVTGQVGIDEINQAFAEGDIPDVH